MRLMDTEGNLSNLEGKVNQMKKNKDDSIKNWQGLMDVESGSLDEQVEDGTKKRIEFLHYLSVKRNNTYLKMLAIVTSLAIGTLLLLGIRIVMPIVSLWLIGICIVLIFGIGCFYLVLEILVLDFIKKDAINFEKFEHLINEYDDLIKTSTSIISLWHS